jgi:23S rRNA pseudouridine1911/1915/1917 synthase
MVVDKNDYTHDSLSRQFQERKTEKEYLALVYGSVKEANGEITVPIGRDNKHRTKISTNSSNLKEAVTRYEVVQKYGRLTYCRVFPKTGRTHQIRVHFLHIGHPLVGDELYAPNRYKGLFTGKIEAKLKKLDRLFLHATRLTFFHPKTEKKMQFEIPLPAELAEFLMTLGE